MKLKNLIKNFSKQVSIDSLPDAIIIINALNDVVALNKKAETVFGYLPNEIVGRNIAILFDNYLEKIHIALAENASQILTAKNRKGEDIIVEIVCSYLKSAGQTIISLKDVTKNQKVLEKLLLEYEKVSKIAQQKRGFISAHATELRNPIHSILNFSQSMLDGICGKPDAKQTKYLSIINKNASELLSLVSNMIVLSQMEADQLQPEYKVFDIAELIESIKSDMNSIISEKNIEVSIDYSRLERRNVYTDETLLRQIIMNLFTNAVKFTDIGQIKIEISHPEIESVNDSGINPPSYFVGKSYMEFSISDTGIGIAEEDKAKIFSEFNQSAKSMTKKYGGTGLGLAITKKLTEILGGSIWIFNNIEQGATFKFIIPVERALRHTQPPAA